MKSELKKLLVFVSLTILCVLSIAIVKNTIDELLIENAELRINNNTLISGNNELEAKNGQLMTSVEGYIADKRELSIVNRKLYDELKELGLKYNSMSSIAQATATENKNLKLKLQYTPIHVIKKDTSYIDTLKCFKYENKYDTISGCISNDSISIVKKSTIPVTIVMQNEYKYRFLWFKWKVINQKLIITSDNQDVRFTNVKLYIQK